MKTIQRNNINIDYTYTGKGDTTLLFIHGAFIDKEYWINQVEYFSKNYTVVTLDLAGHGKSGKDRDDWSIQAFSEDVVTVIHELGLTNVILIGHSLGGDVILEVANKIPETIIGFVGIDNFKNAGTAMPEEIQSQIDGMMTYMKHDFANISEGFARQVLLTPATESHLSQRIVKDYREFDPNIGYEILKSSFAYHSREQELLKQLKFKLYLINVDFIPTNVDLLMKYAHAGFEVSRLQCSSHYPMVEMPDAFNNSLLDIIHKIKANG